MALWIPVILALISEFPEFVAVAQKWISLGKTPTPEDLAAELAQLGMDRSALEAAYGRLFPGGTMPQ